MIPKFRAWHKEAKIFISRFWVSDNGQIVQNRIYKEGLDQTDNVILMQSTGLKDKNGKEIFEGDILRCSLDSTNWSNHEVVFVSEWACFCLFPHESMPSGGRAEIIGNIHENPELLEEVAK